MKIPGYRHLVDVVLPDINNYPPFISFGSWGVLEKVDDGMFYFSTGKIHSFLSLYKNHYDILRSILSLYLCAKYDGIFNVHTDRYPDNHYIVVGVPFSKATKKDRPDPRYVHFYHITFTFDDIGRLENDISSGALNPIEVASWPLKVK